MTDFYLQAPGEVVEYQVYWGDAYDSGETIVTSTWVAPSPLVVSAAAFIGPLTSCKIAGPVAGARYQIVNTTTSSTGETRSMSVFILCEVK